MPQPQAKWTLIENPSGVKEDLVTDILQQEIFLKSNWYSITLSHSATDKEVTLLESTQQGWGVTNLCGGDVHPLPSLTLPPIPLVHLAEL